jgi:hypothetical protein
MKQSVLRPRLTQVLQLPRKTGKTLGFPALTARPQSGQAAITPDEKLPANPHTATFPALMMN